MLTIVLALFIAFLLFFLALSCVQSEDFAKFLLVMAMLIFIISIPVGLSVPLGGYTDWQPFSQIELVSLSNSTIGGSEGFIYVSVSSSNIYTYRVKIDSEFGTKTSQEFKIVTVDGSYVVEVEDPAIDKPYLQIYERSGKKSVWTFALNTTEYQYVFYVPAGTISRDIALK